MGIKEIEKELSILMDDLVEKQRQMDAIHQEILNKMDDRAALRFDQRKKAELQVRMIERGL